MNGFTHILIHLIAVWAMAHAAWVSVSQIGLAQPQNFLEMKFHDNPAEPVHLIATFENSTKSMYFPVSSGSDINIFSKSTMYGQRSVLCHPELLTMQLTYSGTSFLFMCFAQIHLEPKITVDFVAAVPAISDALFGHSDQVLGWPFLQVTKAKLDFECGKLTIQSGNYTDISGIRRLHLIMAAMGIQETELVLYDQLPRNATTAAEAMKQAGRDRYILRRHGRRSGGLTYGLIGR